MDAETWLTAQEAIDVGLADEIAADAPKNAKAWDLSAYDGAPVANLTEIAPEIIEAITQESPVLERLRPNFRADMLLRPSA
jgi:enoyl-CoA hydratase/carnithine racemase